jgi:hypothetical protein
VRLRLRLRLSILAVYLQFFANYVRIKDLQFYASLMLVLQFISILFAVYFYLIASMRLRLRSRLRGFAVYLKFIANIVLMLDLQFYASLMLVLQFCSSLFASLFKLFANTRLRIRLRLSRLAVFLQLVANNVRI